MLKPEFTPKFERDVKRLQRKHVNLAPMKDVIDLILQNDEAAVAELVRRHRMHNLSGEFRGVKECHIANFGDWLLVWRVVSPLAIFLRTGTHDEIFR